MAKKSVATFRGDSSSKRTFVKCIRMDKSERTNSYIFKEELVPGEEVKDFFAKK